MEKAINIELRLIDFASAIIDITEALPGSFAGNHLGGQLLRSGTSPALNYGEARASESRADFIHKMKICLKELRETYNCLRIIQKRNWVGADQMTKMLDEVNQLISIFVKSIATARGNSRVKEQGNRELGNNRMKE